MFKNIWNKWNSFRSTVDDTTATIRAVFWAVGAGAVITIIIGKWLASLNTIQRVSLWVVGACIIIVALTYFLDWRRKRGIDKIPELLAKMDGLVFDYIDNNIIQNTPIELLDDLAKLMNMNMSELKAAAASGNKNRAEQEFSKFTDIHSKRFNSKNFSDESPFSGRTNDGTQSWFNSCNEF
jgi:hypothetical protein